ncbi:MAG: nucleotide exchange factor GrpE [Nitrospinae bacterium]|jgi:molecular chaperone GrpE|nr:nucleotide exchange factor GrpE [Nitrospinota bacterium]
MKENQESLMMENNNSSDDQEPKEKPKIQVVDRRHWVAEEDNTESSDGENIEERYPSFVEKLKKEAEEKDQRLKEYIAAYKEKTSQTDELRARLQRDNEVRLDQFKANLFARLLPILDNLKRAEDSAKNTSDFESLKQGINLVINQFVRELKDNDVHAFKTQGMKFDPKIHEAFLVTETDDPEQDNVILEELEQGYMFKEKLIKAAKVKVAKLKS